MTDKKTRRPAQRHVPVWTHGATRSLTIVGVATYAVMAFGGPTGGQVTGGTGSISNPDATTTRIDQTSNRLAIDWKTFDVAANEKVQFVQPSSTAVALNRILDQKASQIFGAIDANGRVFLINPNGVVFGRDSHINVAGLVASSLDMNSADFMNGQYSLAARDGSEGGLVANHGVIETTPGGFVVLTGGAVINDGVILAELGSITLAAGHKATLDFQGDGMLLFEVDQALAERVAGADAAVSNTGQLIANGGRILLTAQAASDVYSRVVNNEGIARANRIDDTGGVIRLVGSGGEVSNSGLLDASGAGTASSGGTVEVSGDDVAMTGLINADGAATGNGGDVTVLASDTTTFTGQISARGGSVAGDGGFAEVSGEHVLITGHADLRAPNGSSGELLLDPGSVDIVHGSSTDPAPGFDTITDGWIETQIGAGDFTVATADSTNGGNEDITVASDVSVAWGNGNNNTLTLNAGRDISLGGAFDMGNQGTLALLFGQLGAGGTLDLGSVTLTRTSSAKATATGGAGTDTLAGDTGYTISGADSGASASFATWTNIENLTGTSGANTFNVAGGTLSGTVDGAGGTDTLTGDTAYTITGANSGTSASVANWTNIENLTGTSGANTFTVAGGTLSGTADGATGQDTLVGSSSYTITGANSGTSGSVAVWQNIENLSGTTGADTFTVSGGTLSGTADGLAGTDTLAGNTNYTISGADSGTSTAVTTWQNIENLTGTSGANAFTFGAAGSLSGLINGLGGTDTANYAAVTGPLTVTLGTNVTNVETLTGSNAGFTLAGGTTWSITGADDGTVDGVNFVNWANLTGTAGDDTFTVNGGTLSGTANGLAGNDTLAGNTSYTVSGANSGTSNAVTSWTNIENLTGTAGVDTFTFNAALSGAASGLGGNDTFTINNGGSAGTFDGGAGTDTQTYAGSTGPVTISIANLVSIETLVGSASANDILQGTTGADTFTTSGAGAGSVGGVTYSSFENLDGLAGSDTLANDTTYSITGANSGTSNSATTWTNIENLTGTGGADTFTFTAALSGTASGLGGNDTFTINNGGSAGTFDGGAGTDTQTYAGSTGPVTISVANLVSIETLVGSASTNDVLQGTVNPDTFTTSGAGAGTVAGVTYSSFENLDGLGGVDTLANDTTYSITGANSGTSNSATTWTNIENLTGTAGVDTFTFAAGGSLSGLINGLGGADTADYSAATAPVVVTLGTNLTNVETAIGGGAGFTLAGGSAWTISGANDGTVDGVTFTDWANLTGTAGADTFTVAGGTLTGTANGAGGTDTLAGDTAYTITGTNSGTSVAVAAWTNIENLTGTAGADTFTVAGGTIAGTANGLGGTDTLTGDTSYTITGANSGTGGAVANWSNIENLSGSAGADTFTVAGGTLSGTADGLAGADTLAGDTTYTINGADAGTSSAVATWTNFENLTGSAGSDSFTVAAGGALSGTVDGAGGTDTLTGDTSYTITGANSGSGIAVATWTNVENLTGTAGADTFTVAGGTLSGAVNGLGGADTLSGNTTYTISGADSGTAGAVATWSNIENLAGTGGADTFTVSGGTLSGTADGLAGSDTLAGATSYTITGPNSGTATGVAAWTNIENLSGTAGADTFTVVTGGTLAGTVDGLGGSDTLAGPNAATTWDVTGTNAGNLSGGTTLAFSNVETLQGDGSVDTFNLSGNVIANGGGGDDVFNLTSGTGAIAGEGGNDTVAASGNFTIAGVGGGTAAGRTFASMEMLSGTSANDTIAGPGAASIWTLSGVNGGSVAGGAVIGFQGIDGIVGGGGADAFNLDPTFQGSMAITGSPTSTMTIASNGAPGNNWTFNSFDTVDFAPGVILDTHIFSLTSVVTQAGTGTTPLVWTSGMLVTLGGTTVNTVFFIGNTPPLPFTKANDFAVTNVSLANAALNDNALTANNNAVEEVDWAQFDPNLRLFDVNNPGVKLPADQVVDELALFWFDDDDDDEIIIAQAQSPRTLVGLESRRN